MLLSIIIPTKNEEKRLPRLLESVKKQIFSDYEIIVADSKSEDKTLEIAKKFNCRITEGGIPSKARNNGAKLAQGEYLLFLDADVVLPEPNFIVDALYEFRRKKLSGASALSRPTVLKKRYRLFFWLWDKWNILSQYFHPQAAGYCILSLKKAHDSIGGFDETIYFGEDSDYSYRMSRKHKFGILRTVKVYASPRRFQEQGFWKTFFQMTIGGILRLIYGEDRTNRMKYFK